MNPQDDDLDQIRTKAWNALQTGNLDWLQEQVEQGKLDLLPLAENLRVYQAELEIQNEELRTAQAVTERTLARQTKLFAELPDAALTLNPTGLILDANQGATRLFGRKFSQLKQHFLQRLIDPAHEVSINSALHRVSKTGYRQTVKLPLLSDAAPVIVELHLTSFSPPDTTADKDLILCVAIDLTEHEQDKALLTQLHRRAAVLLALPQLAEETDERGFLQRGLEYAEELTESHIAFAHFVNEDQNTIDLSTWSSATLRDHCQATSDGHYPIEQAGLWADSLRLREPVLVSDYDTDTRQRGLPDGHAPLKRLISVPVLDGDMVRMIVGVGNKLTDYSTLDIESMRLIADTLWRIINKNRADAAREHQNQELAIARERAEQSARAKSQFLAKMSHEIRTPLNAILNLGALALEQAQHDQQRDLLSRAQRAARDLLATVNDILDFSKVEAGRLTVEQQPFDLRKLIDDAASLVMGLEDSKPLSIYFQVAPNLPRRLVGDRRCLTQVLNNLLSNAIKFTERGQITMSIRAATAEAKIAHLVFAVRDTGIGLSEPQLTELFQPFHQIDGGITRHYGGTGLGLVISRQLVRLMGGELHLSSTPGHGTTVSFKLSFPRLDPAPLIDSGEFATLRSKRLLLVVPPGLLHDFILTTLTERRCKHIRLVASLAEGLALAANASEQGQSIDLIGVDATQLDQATQAEIDTLQTLAMPQPGAPRPHLLLILGQMDTNAPHLRVGFEPVCLQPPMTPCRLLHALEQALSTPSTPPGVSNNIRALVVDDDPISSTVARRLLNRLDFAVEVVDNGRAALARLKTDAWDLVLIDLHMPELDGIETIRQSHFQDQPSPPHVLAMTAHATAHQQARCTAVGIDALTEKPLSIDRLRQLLGRWFRLPEREPDAHAVSAAVPDHSADVHPANQDAMLHSKLCHQFLKRHHETAAVLQALLEQSHWSDALSLIHRLRGSAGILGLSPLVQAANPIEHALTRNQTPEPAQLEHLFGTLRDTLDSITQPPAPEPDSEPTPPPSQPVSAAKSLETLIPDLQQWHRLLDDDITAARHQGQTLRKAMLGHRLEPRVRAIQRTIDAFDLDKAQTEIHQLIKLIKQADSST
ncbi:ATP-binding protein [Rhabdochromatium marinum]|uniref:ATP-binding protein n=1 Tax=Rhabdochromatium marinum TaxID=48729 RepID=UPI00190740F0|nr:ATP-binding protein [Rhabdochromatium marinum]MBK1649682.1 hypothetical protein [Rhabdochromatium marinum]